MDDDFVPCLVPPYLPIEVEDDSGLSLSSVLLDDRAYLSAVAVSNATTAIGLLSTNKHIHVSFCLARPPRLSYMCVHFPGPAAHISFTVPAGTPAVLCTKEDPKVISTHADLALLRVRLPGTRLLENPLHRDYFVYKAEAGRRPVLDRLPNPHWQGATFGANEVAIFRCSGDTSRYVIAGLRNTVNSGEFKLHVYDSDTCSWISTLLSVPVPARVRDEVLPIPNTATELTFHDTSKVIALGGPRVTICWVDLWRGMLLCDVLDEEPMLRDVPLPKPSRANRRSFCIGCPDTYRDITVVTPPGQRSEIKYVVMETRPGMVPPSRQSVDTSDSDDDDDDDDDADMDVAPYWNATVWTMPVPVTSWKDWSKDRDCKVDVTDIIVENPRHAELLLPLPRLRIDPENATMSLRRLITAHPTLGLGRDGDLVIHLMSKVDLMDDNGWVIAVGAKDKKLRGIAELDSRKNYAFLRYYHHTDFSQYLIKATGEVGALVESKHA